MTLPSRIAPMLATLAPEPFDSPHYQYEIKWDGMRALAFVDGGQLRLQDRRGNLVTERFRELAVLAEDVPDGAVLDGEIIVLERGRSSFPMLQQRQTDDRIRTRLLARTLQPPSLRSTSSIIGGSR